MKTKNTDILMQNKVFMWIAIITGSILSIPLIAMQFTSEVEWKLGDFIVMGALIYGVSSMLVLAARSIRSTGNRIIAGVILLLAFFYIWGELAVGIFTNIGS